MAGLGTTEILLIVLALFLLFGPSRLPQLAKSLGQSRKAFKDGMKEAEEEAANERKAVATGSASPQLNTMSDAELEAEMRRRAEARAEH